MRQIIRFFTWTNKRKENDFMNGDVNSKSVTVQSGKMLSEIIGAHDISDFVMQVENVSPGSPMLNRGAIVCKGTDGFVTLAGSQGSGPNDVYGIVLDFMVDSSHPEATCSVARSGVFNAPALELEAGQNIYDYEVALRVKGIFLEKIGHWATPSNPLP
jgi:hypothetical protein